MVVWLAWARLARPQHMILNPDLVEKTYKIKKKKKRKRGVGQPALDQLREQGERGNQAHLGLWTSTASSLLNGCAELSFSARLPVAAAAPLTCLQCTATWHQPSLLALTHCH